MRWARSAGRLRRWPTADLLGGATAGAPGNAPHDRHHPARSSRRRGRYPAADLEDLFVDPTARGGGVALGLFRALAREAAARDCARIDWAVLDWNDLAKSFYRRLGARHNDTWEPWHPRRRGTLGAPERTAVTSPCARPDRRATAASSCCAWRGTPSGRQREGGSGRGSGDGGSCGDAFGGSPTRSVPTSSPSPPSPSSLPSPRASSMARPRFDDLLLHVDGQRDGFEPGDRASGLGRVHRAAA